MADVKISALPLASTPLTGTEVLPIVQSATTDQVTVANLTAGRAVSASSLTLTTTPLAVGSGGTGLSTLTAGYIPYGNGTSAFNSSSGFTFVGVNLQQDNTGTARTTHHFGSAGGNLYVGIENSAGGGVFTGSTAYAGILGTDNSTPLQFFTNSALRMTLDASGNLGLGVTPSAWSAGKAIEVGALGTAVWTANAGDMYVTSNAYYNGGFKYGNTGSYATAYEQTSGVHKWFTAASGTAGNAITFTQAMTLNASGNLGIGTASPAYKIDVNGDSVVGRFNGSSTAFFDMAVGGTTNGRFGTNGFSTNDFFCGTTGATPLNFVTNNTVRARIDSSGNVVINTAAIATTATDGFLYVPTCAGTPTGTPTTYTGRAPIVVNTTNNKLYFYSGGAWRDAGP
jgi:hypothetical protein